MGGDPAARLVGDLDTHVREAADQALKGRAKMRESPPEPSFNWVRAGGWCVTVTRGITPNDVLVCFGALPGDAQNMPKLEAVRLGAVAYRAGTPKSVLRVGSLGDWSFCYEEWGALSAIPGTLPRLSSGRETLTVDSNESAWTPSGTGATGGAPKYSNQRTRALRYPRRAPCGMPCRNDGERQRRANRRW